MPTYTNYPNSSNLSSNFVELAQYANNVAEGWMGIVWLMTWFVIVFVIMSRNYDNKSAFITASVLTMFFGILFRVIGIVSEAHIIIIIVITLVSIGFGFRN